MSVGSMARCLLIIMFVAVCCKTTLCETVEQQILNCGVLMKRCQVQCMAAKTTSFVRWHIRIFGLNVSCSKHNQSDPKPVEPNSNDFVTTFDVPCCHGNTSSLLRNLTLIQGTAKTPVLHLYSTQPSSTVEGSSRNTQPLFPTSSDNTEVLRKLELLLVIAISTLVWAVFFVVVFLFYKIQKKKWRLTKTSNKANHKDKNSVLKDADKTSSSVVLDSEVKVEAPPHAPTPATIRKNNTMRAEKEFHKIPSTNNKMDNNFLGAGAITAEKNTTQVPRSVIVAPITPENQSSFYQPLNCQSTNINFPSSGNPVDDTYVEAPPLKSMRQRSDLPPGLRYNNLKPQNGLIQQVPEVGDYNKLLHRETTASSDQKKAFVFQDVSNEAGVNDATAYKEAC